MNNITRRDAFKLAGGLSLLPLITSFPEKTVAETSQGTALLWDISTGKQKQLVKDLIARFNSTHSGSVNAQFFSNDPYKTKLRIAMGSENPPELFFNWGGGILGSYVDAGVVHPLPPNLNTERFFPAVMDVVTFDSTTYGFPNSGTQPDLIYYNKVIFDKYDIDPPKTWSELLKTVKLLRRKNIIPISLAGKQAWTELMYEMYLVNRIGGTKPFQQVLDNEPNAWSNPAFINANELILELISEKAFPLNFPAINYNLGESTRLLYTGQAAMQLMGSWDYELILSSAPEFIRDGHLGWFEFPVVEGGEGDPKNVVGNPCNFYSISQHSQQKAIAETFLRDAVMNDYDIRRLLDLGLLPPVKGIAPKLENTDHPEWLRFIYQMIGSAPHFSLSWDQALHPKPAQELLLNLSFLFLGKITPKQFSTRMNQTLETT